MSLTSYRAAPPRVKSMRCVDRFGRSLLRPYRKRTFALGRLGSDLLTRALRHSTIGAESFHGRVRNGIGCSPLASATKSSKRKDDEVLKVPSTKPAADVDRCTERNEIKPIELLDPLS